MFAIVQYDGQYRKAIITDELIRWGEPMVEVAIEGYKIPKILNRNHIVAFDWSRTNKVA